MNKAMGQGMVERAIYAVVMWLAVKAAGGGWLDPSFASPDVVAWVASGIVLAGGQARAWWVNRPERLLDDAAQTLPKNTTLVMQVPPHASASDKDEVKKLEEATIPKVQSKIAA